MDKQADTPPLRWLPPSASGLLLLWPCVLVLIYLLPPGWWNLWLGLDRGSFITEAISLGLATLGNLRFGANFGALMLGRTLDLGVMTLFLVSATLVGLAILRALKWIENLTLLNGLMALVIGVLVLGDAVLLLGLAGMMYPWIFWSLVIVPAIVAAVYDRRLFQTIRRSQTAATEQFGLFEKFLIALVILAVGMNLIAAFTPEAEYDALEYHLGAPKEYLQDGRITFHAHNFYASMPALTEMLYLWAMAVRGDGAAKLFHWAFGALSALAAYGIGARFLNRRVGIWAAVIFYTIPFVTDLSMTARIDLATTFFATMAAWQAAEFMSDDHRQGRLCHPNLILAAIAAGAAFSTKYTGGPVIALPLALAIGWMIGRGDGWKNGVKNTALVLAIAAVVLSPWLIKNFVFTRNPVFPLLHGIFQSPQWDDARNAVFVGFHSPKFSSEKLMAFAHDSKKYFFGDAMTTPLLVMLVPLAFFLPKWSKAAKLLALWAGLAIVCWFAFTFRPWRFIFPTFPVLAVLAASGINFFETISPRKLFARFVLPFVLVAQLCVVLLILLIDLDDRNRPVPIINVVTDFLGMTEKRDLLISTDFGPIWWMDSPYAQLPNAAVVLYVGEARVYHAKHCSLWNTVFDKSKLGEMVSLSTTPEQLNEKMRERRITHIYINRSELRRLTAHYGYLKDMNWKLFDEFITKFANRIDPYKENPLLPFEIHRLQ